MTGKRIEFDLAVGTAICKHCGGDIIHANGKGWIHTDGGGAIMRACPQCGYRSASYPPLRTCPVRHRGGRYGHRTYDLLCAPMVDDHKAAPTGPPGPSSGRRSP